jgi:hypothetical protein
MWTEKFYYFLVKSTGKWRLNSEISFPEIPYHFVRDGIVFETPETPQSTWSKEGVCSSGITFLFYFLPALKN